ncbi:MAG: purine-nucleoside phosphorylase [Lachnospiraceae bacterium]|nr:purine-nucleoside phosphorylase [Lachnospiraceae bacterium]
MSEIYEKLMEYKKSVREKTDFEPRVSIVLGSGLGDYADCIDIVSEVSYSDIKGFPVSTVAGHDGRFIFGYVDKVPVVCMKGRVHHYEGYPMKDVVMPIRLMRLLGVERLILTNAAGGMGDGFGAGDLMLITDHISAFVENPLIGPNVDELGVRFPDMSEIYSRALSNIVRAAARDNDISLKEGVYAQLSGPSYESPAEIRMLKSLGASAIGMSTAVEAIAARHCGLEVCGISLISNLAAGISEKPLGHKEVQEAANLAAPRFKKLVTETVKRM